MKTVPSAGQLCSWSVARYLFKCLSAPLITIMQRTVPYLLDVTLQYFSNAKFQASHRLLKGLSFSTNNVFSAHICSSTGFYIEFSEFTDYNYLVSGI